MKLLRIIKALAFVLVMAIALSAYIVNYVPTWKDAQESGKILAELRVLLENQHSPLVRAEIFSSGRRKHTFIYIHANPTAEDQKLIKMLEGKLSEEHPERRVKISFEKVR